MADISISDQLNIGKITLDKVTGTTFRISHNTDSAHLGLDHIFVHWGLAALSLAETQSQGLCI